MFMHQLDGLIDEVRLDNTVSGRPKKILLQLPSGLRRHSTSIAGTIAKEIGCNVIISGSSCYGACDIPIKEAGQCKADLIIHIGHRKFYRDIKYSMPIIYYEWKTDVDFDKNRLKQALSGIKEKRIGLVSSVQFLHILPKIKTSLEEQGKMVEIGGYVLGCWAEAVGKIRDKVDCFMFVGSGCFHSLGFDCKYVLDLERQELANIGHERHRLEKIRWARIMKAKDASVIGILVSTKPGQHELLGSADDTKKKLEATGKKALILIMDEITESTLSAFGCDAFINTACPRIADDHWSKPMINVTDLDKMLAE
jgi:2-(3-amino-3-carboxypropyl)histidine synthase